MSNYGNPISVTFTSRGWRNQGPQAGTITDNIGLTTGPAAVPEPGTLALLGTGVLGLTGILRRKINL